MEKGRIWGKRWMRYGMPHLPSCIIFTGCIHGRPSCGLILKVLLEGCNKVLVD